MQSVHLFLVSGALAWALHRLIVGLRAMRAINYHPGPHRLMSLSSVLGGVLLPAIPGVAAGKHYFIRCKHKLYKEYGWDAYCEISWLGFGMPTIALVVADAAALKEIATNRSRFVKPTDLYAPLAIFGDNIVNVEGEKWRKYKKLTAPAFSDRNNRLVWMETVRVVTELFEEVWGDRESIEIDHCLDITLPITLLVISAAVFGNRDSWEEDRTNKPPGHQLTFKEAIHDATSEMLLKAALPNWSLGLTERTRRMRLAYEELGMYMNEFLQERKSMASNTRPDLFSLLLKSDSTVDGEEERLDDIEVIGNTFIFLVAGHETTAHTLCFAFGLLALYQDEQEKLYQQVTSIMPDGRAPTFDDMHKLTYPLAVFYETLRMFPPVPAFPRIATEDTVLVVGNQKGETKAIPVPKGTPITTDAPGLHYNPKYWPDPYAFKPERFLDPNWPRDAFISFSAGPRACLGKKFTECEAVATMSMIISKYKVTVKEEPQFASETFEQRRERVLANEPGATVIPTRVPVVFTRRK